ncbi:MAG: NAD(P)H-dependent oxidoreductase [Bryobacteraceae bacterium]
MPPEQSLVVGISGSLRAGSYTTMAVATALRGAEEAGASIRLIDLRDYRLPLSTGATDDATYPDSLKALRELVKSASGIILGTPEYHGSFSGVLKNALDLMGFDEFEGKMIGLVGVSGGQIGAFDALNSLRNVGRALHAWVVPEQASIPEAWKAFNADGSVRNSQLNERLKTVGRQVARFAFLHAREKDLAFVKAWEQAPPNPGG